MFWKFALTFSLIFVLGSCAGSQIPSAIAPSPSPSLTPIPSPTPVPMTTPTPSAVPYRVVESADARIAGRLRTVVSIVAPEAETFEQRGETVILAAQEIQAEKNADVVLVFLEASEALVGEGFIKALSRYAPDGGGFDGSQGWKWEITSSRSPVTPQEIEIAEAWFRKNDSFKISDGFGGTQTDEAALKVELAADFGISPDDVGLFYLAQEDYPSPD